MSAGVDATIRALQRSREEAQCRREARVAQGGADLLVATLPSGRLAVYMAPESQSAARRRCNADVLALWEQVAHQGVGAVWYWAPGPLSHAWHAVDGPFLDVIPTIEPTDREGGDDERCPECDALYLHDEALYCAACGANRREGGAL